VNVDGGKATDSEYGSGDLASSCGDLARDTLSRLQSMGTRDAVRAWSDVETDPGVGACALWRRCVDHAVGGQGLARGSRASRCSHASGALVVVPATAAVTTTTTDNHDQGGRRSHAPHGTIASTRTHGTNIASMCEATAPEAVGVQQHHALAQNPHHIRVPTVQAHDREVAGRLLPRLPWPLERVSARASTAAATGTTANASEPTSPAPPVQKDTKNQTIRAVRE